MLSKNTKNTIIMSCILSVGLDRRAEPDDPLPVGRSKFLTPASYSQLRGGPCDALDPNGERAGMRGWLLDRAKATEVTRLLYKFWLEECLEWAEVETGYPAEIDVQWLESNSSSSRLGYRVQVEDNAINLIRAVN